MFVYSLRAGTVKLVGVLCVALTVLITLIAFVPTYTLSQETAASPDQSVSYRYDKIKSSSDVAAFLSQFGWEVPATPVETKSVTVPREFDKIFAAYNEIQKAQGLNLSKYKGKEVTRYTFQITNYEDYTGTVYANVLVYRNRVIGGDICSADVTGFVHGFEK
ncbi:MAG: DUF4830 domain-containing protein [Ruminococcaceae bacterium]|nr:DUF4830 domain-containing protein [Oscillospiraceae bacterium]